ncbi:MAG: PDZ domain-containing protein [Blastopirellula sp. JB062]
MKSNWYSQGLMWAAMAATLGGGAWASAQEKDADVETAKPKVVEAKPVDEAKPAPEKAVEGRYWIGAKMTAEMPPLLLRHLPQLAEKGVFVEDVFQGSPAADAGLEAQDVLLELNGQPMVDARKLVEAVRQGEGETLKLVVLQKGKERSLEVTPRKMTPADLAELQKAQLMQRMPQGQLNDAMRMRFFGPGQVMPHAKRLPDEMTTGQNVKIQIEHRGNEPAKLHIEKDGDSYDITADQIDQLPDDVRPLVEQALGGNPLGRHGVMDIESLMPHGLPGQLPDGMMRQQLQEIQKMLEEMKAQMRGEPQRQQAEEDRAI